VLKARGDAFAASGGRDWRCLEEPADAEATFAGRTLFLLGAGSAVAQPFVAAAVAAGVVGGLVDNRRAGTTRHGLPVLGDAEFLAAAAGDARILPVLCCLGAEATGHFTRLVASAGRVAMPLFRAMRRLGLELSGAPEASAEAGAGAAEGWGAFADPRQTIATLAALDQLAPTLADDESRAVLWAVVLHRLSWSRRWLNAVASPPDAVYFGEPFCAPGHDEVLVDGGAFDGDSLAAFLSRSGQACRHLHAFEPDPANADRLAARWGHDPRVTLHRAGLWSTSGRLRFAAAATPGSAVAEDGGLEIPVHALDDLALDPVPTLIKLDVEGAEREVLRGGARTLIGCRPRLAIAAYHRVDDLVALPRLILACLPEASLRLRHYGRMMFDTVLYAGEV